MRKQNYNKTQMSYELQVIAALTNKTATKEMIQDIVEDVQQHLKSPVATLDNYCGRFKQAGLKALQENYAIFPDNEEIKKAKVFDIVNLLGNKLLKNQPLKLHTSVVNLIVDYIKGRDNEANNDSSKYIVVGYPQSKSGDKTLPETVDLE